MSRCGKLLSRVGRLFAGDSQSVTAGRFCSSDASPVGEACTWWSGWPYRLDGDRFVLVGSVGELYEAVLVPDREREPHRELAPGVLVPGLPLVGPLEVVGNDQWAAPRRLPRRSLGRTWTDRGYVRGSLGV